MKKTIFTIGYTAFDQERFVEILGRLDITCLVDVRSVPVSSYYPQYNKPVLEALLKKAGIKYRNYLEFGARQENKAFYSDQGYLDFERYTKSDAFLRGVKKIQAGMDMGFSFVLMCAEKDPINCHRSIMIAQAFHEMGFDVQHIRADKDNEFWLESHADLEMRLVRLNGDDLAQCSLFDTDEDRVQKAYRKQNREIGFRLEDE